MNQNNNKAKLVIVVAIIILVGIYIVATPKQPVSEQATTPVVNSVEWKIIEKKDLGFSLNYPASWEFRDSFTSKYCCIYISNILMSTTTAPNASGTPVTTITAREVIKLQVGFYDRKIDDPFKAASTTKIILGENEFLTGTIQNGTEIYLLPETANEGMGVAVFRYIETPESDRELARKIVSSIKILPKSASSTTATTSP